MKKSTLILALLAFLCISACRNEPNDQNKDKATSHVVPREDIQLVCEAVEEPNMQYDAPQHEVFIYLEDTKIKIADILNCEEITTDLYEKYQIPESALVAVGGWWAGAGDYIYVVEENGKFVVKQGEMYEEKEDLSYDYKTVMTFDKSGKEVL